MSVLWLVCLTGMVMGYRVADFALFRTGFINELKMAFVTFFCGSLFGLVLGDVGNTYKWPNDQMMHEGMAFNLVISIIVSAAAGMVLGVSMTAAGGNALVGTAISAGLLPPLVNAGMLISYATVYIEGEKKGFFYKIGMYQVLFYLTHVATIIVVANFVFYLKDVDPRFREGDDSNMTLLTDHHRKLTEREKAELFIGNIKDDLKKDVKIFTTGVKDLFSGNLSFGAHGVTNRRTSRTNASTSSRYEPIVEGDEDEETGGARATRNPLHKPVAVGVEMSQRSPREEVVNFYRAYNPAKLNDVEDILLKYQGREDELLRKLRKQYGVTDEP